MTRQNKNILLLVLIGVLTYTAYDYNFKLNEAPSALEVNECTFAELELERFMQDVAFSESSNRHDIVSRYGYLGKYQFSQKTLRSLGYKITKKEFLSNPVVQDEAMIDLLKSNKEFLQKYINKWDGKKYNGIKVTESGILAAAHLTGATSVKKFFTEGVNKKDANGTSIVDYMTKFADYKFEI